MTTRSDEMMVHKKEKGQTIVLVVIVIFGLIAMAALMVDGGNAYFNRRDAQTAADAGALAGAYEFCVNKEDPTQEITNYVENQNHAVLENWYIDSDTGYLVVETSKEQSNFFAKIFGMPTTTVYATASAGCFPPAAVDSVIPVAWSCRPPDPTFPVPSDSEDCVWKAIPYNIFEEIRANGLGGVPFTPTGATGNILYHDDLNDPDDVVSTYKFAKFAANDALQLYVIMNSVPLSNDVYCESGTDYTDCDLDGDGRTDWSTSERSWLLLDPNTNQAQLDDIVRGELTFGMTTPGWYPGRGGAITDVYKDAVNFVEGEYALIPVFEVGKICGGYVDPSDPLNPCPLYDFTLDPNDYVMQMGGASPETYFRVVGFAEIYVSCVVDKPGKKCPGKERVINFLNSIGETTAAKGYENEMSIEGYFIDGWISNNPDISTGSNAIDLGVYVLSLTE